jgi:hypothetical protein
MLLAKPIKGCHSKNEIPIIFMEIPGFIGNQK